MSFERVLGESLQIEIAKKALFLLTQKDDVLELVTEPSLSCLEKVDKELWDELSKRESVSDDAVRSALKDVYPELLRYSDITNTILLMSKGNVVFAKLFAMAAFVLNLFVTAENENDVCREGWDMEITDPKGEDFPDRGERKHTFSIVFDSNGGSAPPLPDDMVVSFHFYGKVKKDLVASFPMEGPSPWKFDCSFNECGLYYISVHSESRKQILTRFEPFYVSVPAKTGCKPLESLKALDRTPNVSVEVKYKEGSVIVHYPKLPKSPYKNSALEVYRFSDVSCSKRLLYYYPTLRPDDSTDHEPSWMLIHLKDFYKKKPGEGLYQIRLNSGSGHILASTSPFAILKV